MGEVIFTLPFALLALTTLIEVWHDPRKVRIGVYLLTLVVMTVMWATGAVLEVLNSRFEDSATPQVAFLLGMMLIILLSVLTLGVMLVLNGFDVRRREGRGLMHSLSLALGSAILVYTVAAIVAVFANSILAVWILALIGLPTGLLGYGLLAYLLWSSLYGTWMRHWGRPVDAVVVLGAGLRGGRTVPPLLAGRIDIGLHVQATRHRPGTHTPWLVLSGGQGPDELVSEAQAMAEYALANGAAADRLILEDQSRTTAENIQFSKLLLDARGGVTRVAVTTNSYHAFRAATLMRRYRLPGYAVGGRTARYYWPSAFIREYAAILRDNRRLAGTLLGISALPLIAQLLVTAVSLLGH